MGWMRTLLLGDIGNRLDIADAEREIAALRRQNRQSRSGVGRNERLLVAMRDELGRHKLALTALTRFLVAKGLATEEELDEFIREVDAEDGELDGKLPIVEEGRLRLKQGGLPGT